jgi:hypothetical protein
MEVNILTMVPSLVHLLKGCTGKVLILLGSKKGAPEDKNWSMNRSSPTTNTAHKMCPNGKGYVYELWVHPSASHGLTLGSDRAAAYSNEGRKYLLLPSCQCHPVSIIVPNTVPIVAVVLSLSPSTPQTRNDVDRGFDIYFSISGDYGFTCTHSYLK